MRNLFIGSTLVAVLALGMLALTEHDSNDNSQSTKSNFNLAYPSICFAPDASQDYVEEIYSGLRTPDVGLFQLATRWAATASSGGGLQQGDPTIITWSIVPDGTIINAVPSIPSEVTGPSDLVSWLNTLYPGGQNEWLPLFEEIFDRWSAISGMTYVYEPNDDGAAMPFPGVSSGAPGLVGVRGDVRISGHRVDGNSNVLAYNYFPDTGDMVIDTDDNFYNDLSNNSLKMRNVLSHEHGHGMGFSHVCPITRTKLMEPFATTFFDGPQHDDTLAVNRGYGDRFEHNDATGTATGLGSLGEGTTMIDTVSLDSTSDQDFYSFQISESMTLSMDLSPIGFSYLEGPQNPDGSCTPGTNFNSLLLSNPAFQILDGGGGVLATANANPAGQMESVTDVSLDSAGTYYIRVYTAPGADDNVQLYEFDFTLATAGIPCVYGEVLTAWNNPDVVSCLGSGISILEILDAIDQGLVTPP